jgi:hypothetical protein
LSAHGESKYPKSNASFGKKNTNKVPSVLASIEELKRSITHIGGF